MRHILYCLLLIAMAGSSCHKQVLDTEAENLLSSDLAFTTPEKIEAATLAGYDGLQKDFLAGPALIYIDIMGNDVFDRNGAFGDMSRFNMLANFVLPASVWSAGYDAIGRANRALAGITANSSKLTVAKAGALLAECKFVRAVANFYLVNFFGQPYGFTADASHPGIPLITESYTYNDPAANKPRSTVGEVYTAIIKDLTEALADLPMTYTGYTNNVYHTKTRGTKAAAAAFLSRVYLYKGDYTNAKKYAKDVIDKTYGTFALNATVGGAFNKGNYTTAETIWSVPNNATDNPNTNAALPMRYYPSDIRGDVVLSATFLNLATNPKFAADDKRRGMIMNGNTSASAPFKFSTKYTDVATRADWAPIIRYAEVLLTYAEAQARTGAGVDADALVRLNEVRDRARVSMPSYTAGDFSNDKDKFIEAILEERRIELAFEGHRFWDMMRVKATVTGKYDYNGTNILAEQPFGANKNIFPIPQIEVDKSKKVLVQNPGYE